MRRKPKELNVLNQTIFTGDNLPILRGINSKSVDLIYLDPPFNSSRDYFMPIGALDSKQEEFAFKDTWNLTPANTVWIKLIRETHPALSAFLESARLVHSRSLQSYLVMMGERLMEMHRIL